MDRRDFIAHYGNDSLTQLAHALDHVCRMAGENFAKFINRREFLSSVQRPLRRAENCAPGKCLQWWEAQAHRAAKGLSNRFTKAPGGCLIEVPVVPCLGVFTKTRSRMVHIDTLPNARRPTFQPLQFGVGVERRLYFGDERSQRADISPYGMAPERQSFNERGATSHKGVQNQITRRRESFDRGPH
jgi:hypothetical protein